jgi:hypothetical protein
MPYSGESRGAMEETRWKKKIARGRKISLNLYETPWFKNMCSDSEARAKARGPG